MCKYHKLPLISPSASVISRPPPSYKPSPLSYRPSTCKQENTSIIIPPLAPMLSLPLSSIYLVRLKLTGNQKLVNEKHFCQHCYSLFHSAFSIPVINPLGYKPLHLKALQKLLTMK